MRRRRFHSAVLVGVFAAIALIAVAPAQAEKRVALVIGNSAYQNIPRLTNPANDAKLMADTLRSLGFALVGGSAQIDLDKARFDSAVQSFGNLLQGADVALFYYAGHGLQVRGANYLVPVSANPTKEADVDFQLFDSNLVLRQMEGAGAKLNLVTLDACRNNPFGGQGLRAADGGLAQMRAPEGTLISFATQPGNVAQDGADGNSPYTKALAQTIRKPGLGLFEAFNEVGLAVMQATGNAQQPWVSTSPIRGSFFFAGVPAGAPRAKMYFLRGAEYLRYDVASDNVDDGYPKPLDTRYWPKWPAGWKSGVDAALGWINGKVYLFRGGEYLRYDLRADKVEDGYPKPIAGNWAGFPAGWTRVDAALNWGNGKVYFFKGGEYLRFDMASDKVDDGYPQPLDARHWRNWPAAWNSGINAAINWGNGKVYFFKGGDYLSYDVTADKVDDGYPRPIAGNWRGFPAAWSSGLNGAFPAEPPS